MIRQNLAFLIAFGSIELLAYGSIALAVYHPTPTTICAAFLGGIVVFALLRFLRNVRINLR